MGNKSFNAKSWLVSEFSENNYSQPKTVAFDLPPLPFSEFKKGSFSLEQYVVPGWTADGLISKVTLSLKKIIKDLVLDAEEQFQGLEFQNRSLKAQVYNEFLSFIESKEKPLKDFPNAQEFWNHISLQNSPYKNILTHFKKKYCYRSVIIYIFKIRFLVVLSDALKVPVTENNLLNPVAFLDKIFRKGSSAGIDCEAFQSNSYSWFRPSPLLKQKIKKFSVNFPLISTPELLKICTSQQDFAKPDSLPNFLDPEYSHSISHKSFGRFLENLLVAYPQWSRKKNSSKLKAPELFPRVLATKFTGDFLNSLSVSHWLGQELYIDKIRDEIISPDFIGNNFVCGPFLKICYEFQFLTYLVAFANRRSLDPIQLLSKIMKEKASQMADNSHMQMKLFSGPQIGEEPTYKRIILNVSHLPKSNPHYFLLSKIQEQILNLPQDGLLFVFSNQNLFVPSQSDKIEQLMLKLKIEAYFNFENLKGRGEIPQYLYVFSKKQNKKKKSLEDSFNFQNANGNSKDPCLTFRFSGGLSSFHDFGLIVSELENFMEQKSINSVPIFRKELKDGLSFEFHQDAILDGKFLHSGTNDPNKITHPNFFKNLTESCIPLDHFFELIPLDENSGFTKKQSIPDGLLGFKIEREKNFPLVLMADYKDPKSPKLEIIPSDSYMAKKEEYGFAFNQYFGLFPKRLNLNINIFREYFNSNLGLQIIQLSLNGGFSKIKSKLKSLLIPKFFLETTLLPESIEKSLQFLTLSTQELLQSHHSEMMNQFIQLNGPLMAIGRKNPWATIGYLSNFKKSIENALIHIDNFKTKKDHAQVNFQNPLISQELKRVKLNAIYPDNKDVFIEFLLKNPGQINLPLTETNVKLSGEESCLTLSSNGSEILRIYSGASMIKFLEFILERAVGISISALLQNIKIPEIEVLNEIIEKSLNMGDVFLDIYQKTDTMISTIFTNQISSSPSNI